MIRYSYIKVVNTDKLEAEIKLTNLPYCYLETVGADRVYIWMSEELSNGQELILTNLINDHSIEIVIQPAELVKQKILAAMSFGRGLIAEYGASNVLSGYSIEQIRDIMNRTYKVQNALNTGSLYVALTELDNIETDDSVITEEKILHFKHKIQDYLNIPRS